MLLSEPRNSSAPQGSRSSAWLPLPEAKDVMIEFGGCHCESPVKARSRKCLGVGVGQVRLVPKPSRVLCQRLTMHPVGAVCSPLHQPDPTSLLETVGGCSDDASRNGRRLETPCQVEPGQVQSRQEHTTRTALPYPISTSSNFSALL